VNTLPGASKPWWQQATALVSLSAGGAITGFSFVPKAAVDFSSPTSLPVNLLALQHSVRPAPASDATLRTAIVNVAQHYLQLARDKTPAEMEAMIWQQDSADHADHGQSCAAFASLTLELAAKIVGQQSWVTGGSTYPWPLHSWADARVEENPASPGIISIQQDAQTHGRWHPLGDGYQPRPGDWVLFNGHVEVVTEFAHGVLHTIGGDSLPNFSVNAHQYPAPLSSDGVLGFVNNGSLSADTQAGPPASASGPAHPGSSHAGQGRSNDAGGQATATAATGQAAIPGAAPASAADAGTQRHGSARREPAGHRPASNPGAASAAAGLAAIPGSEPASPAPGTRHHGQHKAPPAAGGQAQTAAASGQASIPGMAGPAPAGHEHQHGPGDAGATATDVSAASGGAAIPGLAATGQQGQAGAPAASSGAGHQTQPAGTPAAGDTAAQQAFINAVAPGALASQRAYGVPAAVTIAQAIEESDWGQSLLASKDHNLFGMKGTGPAGSEALPTQEYENGQWITTTAPFRVYHNFAESIDDHGRLLADSGYYGQAMAVRRAPNAFASALTGVYATDPGYGAKLISLMRQYNLYQYDAGSPAAGTAARPKPRPTRTTTQRPAPAPAPSAAPTTPPSSPTPTPTATPSHSRAGTPSHTPAATPTPAGTAATPSPAHSPSTAATPARTPAATSTATASPSGPPSQAAAPAPASGHTHRQAAGRSGTQGQAAIPGVPDGAAPAGHGAIPGTAAAAPQPSATATTRADRRAAPRRAATHPVAQSAVLTAQQTPLRAAHATPAASSNRRAWTTLRRYRPEIPPGVNTAFLTSAKVPLRREEPLYREVAIHADIPWKVLAAADWMQCEARAGYSPVHGEKLGAINLDGTSYTTRSSALEQCADDLRDLAWSVYQIDLTERRPLSVGDLASVFAAFRWGRLLVVHRTSALEFPYSVAGLTVQHLHMRWPKIAEPDAPDKPGARFRRPFGAVPIVLGLGYPAVV
jgi:flagellum-specific peptidoglycan hydrolase FlgJ